MAYFNNSFFYIIESELIKKDNKSFKEASKRKNIEIDKKPNTFSDKYKEKMRNKFDKENNEAIKKMKEDRIKRESKRPLHYGL